MTKGPAFRKREPSVEGEQTLFWNCGLSTLAHSVPPYPGQTRTVIDD